MSRGTVSGNGLVTDGLVLSLDAANARSYPGSGTTWSNLTSNLITGSLINGPTFDSGNGGSIQFDGVDDYVSFNVSSYSSYTITFWIKVISYPGDEKQIFSTSGDRIGITILNRKFFIWNGTSNSGVTTISLGTWYNVVVTGITSSTILYLNGLVNSSFGTFRTLLSGAAAIGYYLPTSARYINANISQSQIYNRALSPTEVLQNYNATKTRFGL